MYKVLLDASECSVLWHYIGIINQLAEQKPNDVGEVAVLVKLNYEDVELLEALCVAAEIGFEIVDMAELVKIKISKNIDQYIGIFDIEKSITAMKLVKERK